MSSLLKNSAAIQLFHFLFPEPLLFLSLPRLRQCRCLLRALTRSVSAPQLPAVVLLPPHHHASALCGRSPSAKPRRNANISPRAGSLSPDVPPGKSAGRALRREGRAPNPTAEPAAPGQASPQPAPVPGASPRAANPRSRPTHRRNMRSMSLICRRLNSLNSV